MNAESSLHCCYSQLLATPVEVDCGVKSREVHRRYCWGVMTWTVCGPLWSLS